MAPGYVVDDLAARPCGLPKRNVLDSSRPTALLGAVGPAAGRPRARPRF